MGRERESVVKIWVGRGRVGWREMGRERESEVKRGRMVDRLIERYIINSIFHSITFLIQHKT